MSPTTYFPFILSLSVFLTKKTKIAHEHNNALRRWMVSGPEMARLIGEFEHSTDRKQTADSHLHDQKEHVQKAFARDVRSLREVIEEMGSPFTESSSDLLVLDSRNIADAAVAETASKMKKLGRERYEEYVSERLVSRKTQISDPIKRNNLHLFHRPPVKNKSNKQQHISSLKNDCSLFSRLYIYSQVRTRDLDAFFKHDNQSFPPALSQTGVLRCGTKSDLLRCLEDLTPVKERECPSVQVIILDGAVIVNMLQPGTAKTFLKYAADVFMPYIQSQLACVARLGIIWDRYLTGSLKASTRIKRGKGIRTRVEPSCRSPGNWQEFMRVDANKEELFRYLAKMVVDIATSKDLVATDDTGVLCTNRQDVSGLSPCTHE